MSKLKILGLLMLIWGIWGLAWADDVTISTYYPSPSGVYLQLVSQTLGVGNNAPDPATSPGNVWIAGKVGIGTTTPQAELEVTDTLRLKPVSLGEVDSTVEGAIYYNDNDDVLKYYYSGQWRNFGTSLGSSQTIVGGFIFSNRENNPNDPLVKPEYDYIGCDTPKGRTRQDKYLENLAGRGPYPDAEPATFVGAEVGCPDGSVITGINVRIQDRPWGCSEKGEIQYIDLTCTALGN